ncbi:hypothetical protein BHM03_00036930, partial [Ensete ventricosum]
PPIRPKPNMPSQIRPPPPPRLSLPISLLFLVLLLFSVATVGFASDYACPERSTSCGGVTNITYPFWFAYDDTAEDSPHCGYQDFKVICRNDTPILRLADYYYTVILIDHGQRIITLADADLHGSTDHCPRVRHNLTFPSDSSLAYAPSDANLTFFFNCTGDLTNYMISCLPNAGGKKSFVLTDEMIKMMENTSSVPQHCEAVIVIPVLQASLNPVYYELAGNYEELLLEGFNLQWSAASTNDTCSQCEKSGGWCGLNKTTSAFACFCSDGRIESDNCSGTFTSSSTVHICTFREFAEWLVFWKKHGKRIDPHT